MLIPRRQPFDLRSIILSYNLAIAALNAYIAAELCIASLNLNYNYLCEPVRESFDPEELRVCNNQRSFTVITKWQLLINIYSHRSQMQYGGSTSPNVSNSAIVCFSCCEKRIINWRSCTSTITARCSRCGGSASNGCPVALVRVSPSCALFRICVGILFSVVSRFHSIPAGHGQLKHSRVDVLLLRPVNNSTHFEISVVEKISHHSSIGMYREATTLYADLLFILSVCIFSFNSQLHWFWALVRSGSVAISLDGCTLRW